MIDKLEIIDGVAYLKKEYNASVWTNLEGIDAEIANLQARIDELNSYRVQLVTAGFKEAVVEAPEEVLETPEEVVDAPEVVGEE